MKKTFLYPILVFSLFTIPFLANAQINQTLKHGDSNEQVTLLQKILNLTGKTVASPPEPGSLNNETTYYGSLTASAVKAFQCEKGIVCEGDEETTGFGQVGPKTRSLLNSLFSNISSLFQQVSTQFPSVSPSSQTAAISGSGSGLVAHYTFDDGTATDSSGNGNNGTVNGATATSGKVGSGALSFDGVDDYVNIPHQPSLDIGQEVTVALWFKDSSWASADNFFTKFGNFGHNRYEISNGFSGGQIQFVRNSGFSSYTASLTNTAYFDGNWTFVVGVSTGGDVKMYVGKNGTITTASGGHSQTWNTGGTHNAAIGARTDGSAEFVPATIDDVRIYNRALSTTEITELYNYTGAPQTPDTEAPTVPTNLSSSNITESSATISWSASIDTGGGVVSGYKIYRNGVQVGTSNTTSFTDSNLSSNTTYSYTVSAYDNVSPANTSPQSSPISITTSITLLPDTTSPSTPSNLQASAVSSSQINLSWSASTDPMVTGQTTSGVSGYRVYRNGTQVGTPTNTSYSDTGLSASTQYSYTVAAIDDANNLSPQSSSVSATTATDQTGAEIIPSDRRVTWQGNVGIPGGIPNRTTICSDVTKNIPGSSLLAVPNDGLDDGAAIQAALDVCPANQVVYIPAGTYRINQTLVIKDYTTLRGAGPSSTIIEAYNNSHKFKFGAGSRYMNDNVTQYFSVIGDVARGATSVTLSGTNSDIKVGNLLHIDQLNDGTQPLGTNLVTKYAGGQTCNHCSRDSGNRALSQVVEITGVSGNVVTFQPGLYWGRSASLQPQAFSLGLNGQWSGVEDLKISAMAAIGGISNASNFHLEGVKYSWVKNVDSDFTNGDHVKTMTSFRSEVRDSYFHDGYVHGPGQAEVGIMWGYSSAILYENNVIRRGHAPMYINWGSSGNVFAYNYIDHSYRPSTPNHVIGGVFWHGAHPMMNLIEGNVVTRIFQDNVWGSASHETIFRNYVTGVETHSPPYDTRGPENTSIVVWPNYARHVVYLGWGTRNFNFVGNILGAPHFENNWSSLDGPGNGTPVPAQFSAIAPQSYSAYQIPSWLWVAGYGSTSNHTETAAWTTTLRHGNWDVVRKIIEWDSAIANQNIPDSLFYSAKPAWWPASVSWPPIGPDVSGLTNKIPAQLCYEQGKNPGCLVSGGTPVPTHTLSVSKSGTGTVSGGSISCGSTCIQSNINSGTSVTLSASPSSGSTFAGWSGGGCSGTGACTVSVTANTTVTATFNTTADTTPPTLSNLTVTNITTTGATVNWTTNEPADSQIEYGLTTSYGSSSALDSALVTSHSVAISVLSASYQRLHFTTTASNPATLQATSPHQATAPSPLPKETSLLLLAHPVLLPTLSHQAPPPPLSP